MGLLIPCSLPKGGFLYTMIILEGVGVVPFKSCPGGMVLDEIDTCRSVSNQFIFVMSSVGVDGFSAEPEKNLWLR